jgi:NAD(P)H-dependent FMN reductase
MIVASGHISFKSVQTNLTQLMSYFGVLTNPNSVYITVDKIDENNRLTIELKLRLENILDETIRLFEVNK